MGAPDLAVKLGSPINLTCVISHSTDQLQFVFWYRNARMINYDLMNEKRGKVVISSRPSQNSTSLTQTHVSNLQIYRSTQADAGNYTCMPSGAQAVSIYVHVFEGKSCGVDAND